MASIPPNQHTMCNLFVLTEPLMGTTSGKQVQTAKGKHKFFAWLLVQSKFLTADKLAARNWLCNPVCSLYDQEPETAAHLSLNCQFARALWGRIERWSSGLVHMPVQEQDVENWWNKQLDTLLKQRRRTKAALLMHTAWNIGKARNSAVFDNQRLDEMQVESENKAEIMFRRLACGGPVVE